MRENYYQDIEETSDHDGGLDHHYAPHPGLNKSQKIAAASLAFFGVLIVVLWMWQMNSSLTDPLGKSKSKGQDQPADACADGSCAQSELGLHLKDTDKDGLTDWDELNIYFTSPYLEDSDSDGLTDREEIEAGSDPNCPLGKDCGGVDSADSEGEADNNTPLVNEVNKIPIDIGGADELTEKDTKALLSNIDDPAILRQMLLDAGFEQDMLDQFSDEELLKSFKEVLSSSD